MLHIVLGLLVCLLPFATARADSAELRLFTIEAQSLDSALKAFAFQSQREVFFTADLTRGKRSPGISGKYSDLDALNAILAGTGLTYDITASKAILVRSPAASPASKAEHGDEGRSNSVAPSTVPANTVAEPSAATPQGRFTTNAAMPAVSAAIPEILVTGSSALNVDSRRTQDDPQPYVIFDAAEIQQSDAVDVEDFLKSRLPMNAVRSTNSQSPSSLGNQSSINLRGLGTNQTLILIDGRRMAGTFNTADFSQPDINGIPLSAIERIEILPATASGIYGGGATGGVVNIITRHDYSGFELGLRYDNTFLFDDGGRHVDLSGGFPLEDGRTTVRLLASYSDSGDLLTGDRDFVSRSRALQLANNPSAFYDSLYPPLGATPNISSADGSNLVLTNGTPLNSPFTYVPKGYPGVANDGGAALVANAGHYNLALANDLNGARQSLLASPTTSSADLTARRRFGDDAFEAYADVSFMSNKSRTDFAGVTESTTLPSGVRDNPFTTAINVTFPAVGLDYPFESDSQTVRATSGVIVPLPADWTASAEYTWSRARYSFSMTSPAENFAFAGDLADGTVNVVRDLNVYPLNYGPYLLPSPDVVLGPGDTILNDATLRTSGPVARLPGGAVTLSASVERQEARAEDVYANFGENGAYFFPSSAQIINSYYLEAKAPLVSQANALPGVRVLDLQASVRRDDYSTESPSPSADYLTSISSPIPSSSLYSNRVEATKFTVGSLYSPLQDLALRASLGSGFLPPSIGQIAPFPTFASSLELIDPLRGYTTEVGNVNIRGGGNPNLLPESSRSWSAGAIFTPRWLTGLRLSLDYTRIIKTDEIATLSDQEIVDLEGLLPGRVTRAPLTAQDRALGYTGGVITGIDDSPVNIAGTRLQAYDLQLDYYIKPAQLGEFHFYVIGTYQPELAHQTLPDLPFLDAAGYDDGPLKWRGNAGLTWEKGPWTAGWNMQFYDSYYIYPSTADVEERAQDVLSQGAARVPSQSYHDLFATYRFQGRSAAMLKGLQVSLGINNVLNQTPPILASTGSTGTFAYSNYGDPRLRRFSLSLHKQF